MEQHPIPQQISSYEFRLIGSMTLKQFFKVGGGIIIAFMLYSSHLPFLIKWPLVLTSAGFGLALAFLPINEQPLETYIIAFFKSVFSPTIYLWQKKPPRLDLLETGFKKDKDEEEEEEELIAPKTSQLEEFLASLPKKESLPERKPKKTQKTQEPKKKKEGAKEEFVPTKPKIEIDLPQPAPPQATAEPDFSEIPMPKPPQTPNIIVGMVIDAQGKIVEDAIVEIQDIAGNPVRALRTNRLGQFRSATPLANGEYLILIEKEGHQFDILKVKAEGKIIPPIKIKAKQSTHGSQ